MEKKGLFKGQSSFWTILNRGGFNQSFLGKFNLSSGRKIPRIVGNASGFTLIELIIVIAILSVLSMGAIAVLDPLTQFKKASDAKIKSDLSQVQKGLETYYQDYGKYPLKCAATYQIQSAAGGCLGWGSAWQPYMNVLPSDPTKGHNYAYYVSADRQTYYLYANLNRGTDPQICGSLNVNKECSSVPVANLCGAKCNFGVSSPNVNP